ncbi:MAG: PA2778 family cysteine peptidase [Gammaproteobacteria bacterium]|jgi:tetratricopeptide (TPR) repeat protein
MTNYRKTASWFIGSLFLFCLLSACSTLEIDQIRTSASVSSYSRVEIENVPFFAQQEYQCGPAALAMLINWSGVDVTPEEIKPLVYVPDRKGSFQAELIAATRSYDRIPYVLLPSWQSLITEIEAGNPVLVFQNLGVGWFPRWHYAVVTGIDIPNNEIVLHSGVTEKYVVSLDTFERTWQRANKWAMVVMPANVIPASADPLSYLKAASAFEQQAKLDIALQAYEASVSQWPTKLVAIMGLGNVYYQLDQLEDAKLTYERAIEINAEYAPAHNNLAQVLLDMDQLDAALKHARIAVRIGGIHAENYRETLSLIEQRQGVGGLN